MSSSQNRLFSWWLFKMFFPFVLLSICLFSSSIFNAYFWHDPFNWPTVIDTFFCPLSGKIISYFQHYSFFSLVHSSVFLWTWGWGGGNQRKAQMSICWVIILEKKKLYFLAPSCLRWTNLALRLMWLWHQLSRLTDSRIKRKGAKRGKEKWKTPSVKTGGWSQCRSLLNVVAAWRSDAKEGRKKKNLCLWV